MKAKDLVLVSVIQTNVEIDTWEKEFAIKKTELMFWKFVDEHNFAICW